MTESDAPALPSPELKAFEFHVSARLTASADVTVLAPSFAAARIILAGQLNLRDSQVTCELRDSASVQLTREMGADAFAVMLSEERAATPEELDEHGELAGG